MKNSMQIITLLMVIATCTICLAGAVLVMMDGFFLSDVILALLFPPLMQRLFLQTMAFGVIFTCLTISYIYFIYRNDNKTRVSLVYAVIGLLVALAFVFPEYNYQQEKLTIREVCDQYDLAVAVKDYETAYEFMSPAYRQSHSLAQFIAAEGSSLKCGYPYNRPEHSKSVRVLLLHAKAREASVIHTPFGSINRRIFLEKVDDKWYLTGVILNFHA